ncbi:MAG: peptidase domain-containing ABC transporter [Chromatiales bacterium]
MDADLSIARDDILWALGSLSALHRLPFDSRLALQQFPPPYDLRRLMQGVRALGFRCKLKKITPGALIRQPLPCLVLVRQAAVEPAENAPSDGGETERVTASSRAPDSAPSEVSLALALKCDGERVLFFEPGNATPQSLTVAEFKSRHTGAILLCTPKNKETADPDTPSIQRRPFGFRWFLPELLKHKGVWRDVLLASLAIQLMALATPLFTQVIIDKVVVHQTQSTLTVIGIALLVFMLFTAVMSWTRQYLILHTGNRVDAVLGSRVWTHLLRLPARYFEHRPTGVVVARLHAVETIRDFLASAAVTLILDFPFLLIFLAVMIHYSVTLSMISVAVLSTITIMSLFMAPVFRRRLNEQFLIGARNQGFLTEYVAGVETVKSLQFEPLLQDRYGELLADYVRAGFATRQLGNTYNTTASALEQLMTLLILWIGACLVMTQQDFTIGMLVAFQMFASRLSQPLLRLVGLWQQFQQAHIAVARLGDIMDAPPEPHSLTPKREATGRGHIELRNLAFRFADHLPYLYRGLDLALQPGRIVALIGPSGAGKSTLAKLLQGFYLPSDGQILLDGRDLRYLAANELRQAFGVVPQETVLFSGTIYDNLLLANPHATFEQIIAACKRAEIHDVIEKLPKGYQTEVGERGVGLSGGQKQRLAIARALLKGPKILIFDEATSHLDAATAEQLAKTINTLKGRVTVLFIAHQIPKGLQIDEVVQIGGGAGRDEKHMSVIAPEKENC